MSYLKERIFGEIGITEEQNKVKIKDFHGQLVSCDIFSSDEKDNIKILQYKLNRDVVEIENDEKHEFEDQNGEAHGRTSYLIRYNPEYLKTHPDSPKYKQNKGEMTRPFFCPDTIEKYEKKEHIKNLYLTEGYIKAFTANIKSGMDIIGLQSVTCYSDKFGKLHEDIIKIITECGVRNVVILFDADCEYISEKALEREEDLSKRPAMFLNSAISIKNLLSNLEVEVWFMHPLSNLKAKGIDDVFLTFKEEKEEILKDANDLGAVGKTGVGKYFYRLNLTTNSGKLRQHLHINNIESFYVKWAEIIGSKTFTYFGSKYRLDEEGKLTLELPGELTQYYRIGTGFYRLLPYTDVWTGEKREKLVPWQKGCIIDDFKARIKNPIDKITKLDGFTFFPDNERYQRIVDNKWNFYSEIDFTPESGKWDTIRMFIKHIFDEQFDLGLDYFQLLYQRPKQQLPILCLVSKERQTGKTTFCNFLNDIFGENCVLVGNNAFTGQFNGFMAGKTIVCCDETKLADRSDTVDITEKIKRLATERYTMIEFKGQDAQSLPNFAKFILCSNNESNFIYTDKDEVRFWVRKIGHLDGVDTKLIERMHEEIPAFLYFLNNRILSTKETTRAWFDFELIKTKALQELQDQQLPTAIRDIKEFLEEMFYLSGRDTLEYSIADLINDIPFVKSSKISQSKLKQMISEHFGIQINRGRYSYFYKLPQQGLSGETTSIASKCGSFFVFSKK